MAAYPQHSSKFTFSGRTDDSDSLEETNQRTTAASRQGSRAYRSSGACVHCKSLKVRCEFNQGETDCQRCQAGNFHCVARTRKKRKPAPTHEDLQERSLSQDRQIQHLLLEFDKLKTEKKIRNWMSKAQVESASDTSDRESHPNEKGLKKAKQILDETSAELAVTTYFQRQGLPSSFAPPDIVKYCALYPDEILELFAIFYERINPYFSILDPELHTPKTLIWTCPFLFTVVCAVASRYYDKRPNLYSLAKNFSRDAAGKALVDCSKSVDVCQAYLLMAVYPVPKKKWVEDRSWLLMGVAIRMAIELELDLPPPPSLHEREKLNRTRTWLNCFCVDASHAIQFGKMPMLRLDDYMARNSREWYKSSELNTPFDIHLYAYVDILILMAQWRAAMGEDYRHQRPDDGVDVPSLAVRFDEKLINAIDIWVQRYAEAYDYMPLPICSYRGYTTQMITAYLRLVVLSTGFQYAVKKGLSRDSYIVKKSMDAARTVIQIMIERLYPTGNLRFAMEANFLYVSFAAAFLLNLLRPKFLPLLDEFQHQEIVDIVRRLIKILGSREVALDGRHTPALYSRFLSSLLDKYHATPPITPDRGMTRSPAEDVKFIPQYHQERQSTPPNLYYWPDTPYAQSNILTAFNVDPDFSAGMIYGESEMDFSMNHFLNTVNTLSPSNFNQPPAQVPQETFRWDFQGDALDHAGFIGSPSWPHPQFTEMWSGPKY